MSPYNFKPDLKALWDSDGLTPKQAYGCALGITAESLGRLWQLCQDNNWRSIPSPAHAGQNGVSSDEEADFLNAIQTLALSLPDGHIGPLLSSYLWMKEQDYWGGSKQKFIKNLYEKLIPAPEGRKRRTNQDFVNFLKDERGEWPTHWSKYEEPTQYFLDRATFDFNKNIKTREEAVIALYGTKPEKELEYRSLKAKGNQASDEERFLMDAQIQAHAKMKSPCADGGMTKLLNIMAEDNDSYSPRKRIPEWTGDFKSYLQALYDAGVIFAEHMEDIIRRYYPDGMEYSQDAEAIAFYKKWEAYRSWTFAQACLLYGGNEPVSGGFQAIHLREDRPLFMPRIVKGDLDLALSDNDDDVDTSRNENACTPQSPQKMENLRYIACCHVTARELTPLNREELNHENWMFSPKDITTWLIKNTVTAPPPALLQVLGLLKKTSFRKTSKTPVLNDNKHLFEKDYLRLFPKGTGAQLNAAQQRDTMRLQTTWKITDPLIKEMREKHVSKQDRLPGARGKKSSA
jgi:hypothetical protein